VSGHQFRAEAALRNLRARVAAVVALGGLIALGLPAVPAPAASEPAGRVSPASAHTVDAGEPAIVRDVSFPQCGGALPRRDNGYAAVLGTNNGIAFSRNPCLVSQLGWAKRLAGPPAFYANTGNPGPARARRWPLGQSSPKVCSGSNPDSLGCAYDYGWNAAWASYTVAVDAAQRLHRVGREDARARAANVSWWLDVETMNSWRTIDDGVSTHTRESDVAAIAGEVDALRAIGVESVGIYSTGLQWNQITGGDRVTGDRFAGIPVWLAGYGSKADAIGGCTDSSFTDGPVQMTQYLGSDDFDADVVCGSASA